MTSVDETPVTLRVDGHALPGALHDAHGDALVLFCHGFRGERSGPNRTFVTAARALGDRGISSLRFDQHGSGDSGGDFIESRFDDWVAAVRELARRQLDRGRRVALLGQSMGASAAICAAADLAVSAVVAWVPDANIDGYVSHPEGFMEEGGQRVADEFWEQAHRADVVGCLRRATAPSLLVFVTEDEYVSQANREALIGATGPRDRVEVLDGYTHSAWSFEQAGVVIDRSVDFLAQRLAVPA